MTDNASPFDASASALGYLHQCLYALLLGLQRDEEANLSISIEKLDDIAFHDDPSSPDLAKELLQVKHHIERTGGLGDRSEDIWKTLRIWVEAVKNKQTDLDHVTLCLLTTSTPTNRNAIRLLSPDSSQRKTEEARSKLEKAGAASTSDVVANVYAEYMSLSETQRKKLFKAIYLLDSSAMAVELQAKIASAVRLAVEPQHRSAFVERLQGWWYQRVVQHLSEPSNKPIPIEAIQRQIHEIRNQFRRECLPDDLLDREVPAEATPDDDDRVFVLQLVLIGLSPPRLRVAQEDQYRAFTQRSRWVKDKLIGMEEGTKFERRLIDGWNLKFLIMQDEVVEGVDDTRLARHGINLYSWVETEAPAQSSLWIRPQFQSAYMVRGSFHMLANDLRVGWHPEYRERITAMLETNGREPA